MTQQSDRKQYKRFSPQQRFEHFVLIVTFVGLALTGLPQKYPTETWAKSMIEVMGGIESTRIIHRFLATLLMIEAIYHGGVISYKLFVLGYRAVMMPGLRDLRDLRDWFLFNLGLKAEHPHLPRYNFGEKAEYWALIWGTVIMVITGFIMWNPIAVAKYLPGEIIPAARAAHGGEALLAVLSILTWHMYNVHFKGFNRSMFTGKISHEAMRAEHAEELEAIEQGAKPFQMPAEVLAGRKRLFWPYAAAMTAILVGVLYFFVTFETSSIATVPRQDVLIFAPRITPEAADPAVGAALWPTLRCARCHGDDAGGNPVAPSLLALDLTFEEFYRQVRNGVRQEMPAFSVEEIPDRYLLHLWAWLASTNPPSS
jgi:formate dehydrogenase gamma subunit